MLRRLRIENLVLIRGAELYFGPGLNAITGETGAGKTILAQAVGLLLGARGEASLVGADGDEAYVEAEFDSLPEGDPELEPLADLRPAGESELVIARRVFRDGRTRAYAWGRSAAREDVAAAGERVLAMSGQFEQRRLARPAYQLEVLDAYAGEEQVTRRRRAQAAWRELHAAGRRRVEASRAAEATEERLAELRALVEDTQGLEPGLENELRRERERLRHVTELAQATASAVEALAPEDADGAAGFAAAAGRALVPAVELAPELGGTLEELRDAEVRLREGAASLRSFLAGLEADPRRLQEVEAELDRIASARRRFACASYEELVERAAQARAELDALGTDGDTAAATASALAEAQRRVETLAVELRTARAAVSEPFAAAVAGELRGVGMGDGEFRVELREVLPGPVGADEVSFLIRPNPGLPFAPVGETASGGELSRIALAIAAVAGGETLVFDEIDAGIGGRTANAVGGVLARLAERVQVITITHLPQIASVAERHFRVEKVPGDPTHTRIEALDEEARREEIERMLGGREFLSSIQQ